MDSNEQNVSTILDFGPVEDTSKQIIKVVGVGGAGGSAVNRMKDAGLTGVQFIAMNTDAQALHNSKADVKIHLGHSTTNGLGAGADPTVGETAALLYTAGTSSDTVSGIMDSARTLSVHMYALSQEGLYINQTYATAVVLLIIVVGINALSASIAKRVTKRKV